MNSGQLLCIICRHFSATWRHNGHLTTNKLDIFITLRCVRHYASFIPHVILAGTPYPTPCRLNNFSKIHEEYTSLEKLKRKTTKGVWVAVDLYQLITWLKLYSCVGVKQHIYKLNIWFLVILVNQRSLLLSEVCGYGSLLLEVTHEIKSSGAAQ